MTCRPLGGISVALATLLVLPLAGCAFGNRHANLHYPPVSEPQGPQAVAALPQDAPALAVAVTDMRQGSHTHVGEVRNGWGMHTADVETQQDAAEWVKQALERELTAQGFRVVQLEGAPALLSTEVITIHCEALMNYEAVVELRVEFKGAPSIIPAAVHVGHGSTGVNFAATDESYSESLALALENAAREIAAQIKRALTQPAQAPPAAGSSS